MASNAAVRGSMNCSNWSSSSPVKDRKSLKMSFYMTLICYIYRYTLTQIYHKKSSQGCVESGPTPHVTEVGLIVHTQERKVLTLSHRRKTRHLSALESYSKNYLKILKLLFVMTFLFFFSCIFLS